MLENNNPGDTVTKRSPVADKIARELRRRIIAGVYPPHSYLGPERELARELGTSRRSVSAALEELARNGWVVQTRGRGTRVLPQHERLSAKPVCVINPLRSSPTAFAAETLGILEGIRETFSRIGCRYEVLHCDDRPSADEIQDRYRAVLFIESGPCEQQIAELQRRHVPVVVANLEVDVHVSATWVDHQKATQSAVHLLVALGHRRIAFVGREPHLYFYGKAREGYLAGLATADIPFDESLLVTVGPEAGPFSAYFGTKALLRSSASPTAIVAARDILAQGACQAVAEAGYLLGRDISVIGFDDCTWREAQPFLTTFREPCHELGAVAAEMMIESLDEGGEPSGKREIEAPLILRRSVGPLIFAEGTAGVEPDRPKSLEIQGLRAILRDEGRYVPALRG